MKDKKYFRRNLFLLVLLLLAWGYFIYLLIRSLFL